LSIAPTLHANEDKIACYLRKSLRCVIAIDSVTYQLHKSVFSTWITRNIRFDPPTVDVRIDLQECSSLTLTRVLRANPVECIIVELSCSGPNVFAILNVLMK